MRSSSMNEYKFPCEPLANSESCVVGPQYRFTLLDDKVLRYEWSADGVFEDRASTFAINRKFKKPEFRVEDKKEELKIITPRFYLTYDKQRFSPNGFAVTFTGKQTRLGEWRFGEPGAANLGGTARTIDDVDGRIDMGDGVLSRAGYSILDDSRSMLFDGKGFVTTRKAGDRIDGYLFCFGYDYKGAMQSFYAISGKQPPVPRWCLGNWWSRYHAYDETEYLDLMDKFKARDIPLSVAVIDMDWHLVHEAIVSHAGWTGYTWNKSLFPDPERFTKALHDRKLKVTLNDHPHAGIHSFEDPYEEMARVLGHDISHKAPIFFDPTSPKFMHAFLTVLHRRLEREGCDFWWIDWQQGSYSRIPGFDPLWLLNHFCYLDHKQNTDELQALIFSRYGGPGSHRYPIGFSGDSVSTWASLEFQPEFTATASNVGYGWWSHDIGGHIAGFRDDERTVRWVQFGIFSPILRLHSTRSRWMSKEPWLYRAECELAMQKFMQFRHRLVPYIYSETAATFECTAILPLVQPLYWSFPEEKPAYDFLNEYYFGSALVVAPVVQPRDQDTALGKTRLWIPPHRHVDIFSGIVYDGNQTIDTYRTLQQIPVLAAEGAIIPLDKEIIPGNGCANPDGFEVLVVVGRDGLYHIFEHAADDAESVKGTKDERYITIEYDQNSGRIVTTSAGRDWTFRFVSFAADLSEIEVLVDDKPSSDAQCAIETNSNVPSTIVTIPSTTKEDSIIKVEIGKNPQLAITDHTQTMSDLLLSFQMEFKVKDSIWKILETKQPATIKVAGLLSLGLEEHILGPLVELLLSDSRQR